MLCREFDEGVDMVDYMVRSAWISLRAMMVVKDFSTGGLENNTAIASSFVRFLTAQTGSNSSAGVGSALDKLERDLRKEIKDVSSVAKSAQTTATSSESSITQLFKKNKSLIK
jgi:hypothetical protein